MPAIVEWFFPEGLYTISMIGVFAVGAFTIKFPVSIAMAFAAIAGALIGGAGFPLRHLVEGMFGYLDTILVIYGNDFYKTASTGLLNLAAWIIRKFRKNRVSFIS